jgi:hypothetical protein
MLLLPTQGPSFRQGAFNQIGKAPLFARASPSRAKKSIHRLGCEGRCLLLARYCSRHRFEQNCLCAKRWRTRPNLPLHISQRGFGLLALRLVLSLIKGGSKANPGFQRLSVAVASTISCARSRLGSSQSTLPVIVSARPGVLVSVAKRPD